MSRKPSARVAVLLVLLLSGLFHTAAVSAASPRAAANLLSIPAEASLPVSGHIRFVRVSADGNLLFVGRQDGSLARSTDGGKTWQEVPVGVAGGPGAQSLDLRISQSNPKIVWAAGLSGVFRSIDGGLTWAEADTRSDAPGRAIGSVLALDPRHPEAAYLAGYRNGGLYATHDGGQTWQEVLDYPVSGVAVDPASGAIIYAISRTAGVQRSIDHGQTWSKGVFLPAYTGIGAQTAEPGRLLSVGGPGAGLYAAMDGGGIERSLDGGRTWQDLSYGLPQSPAGLGFAVPYDLTVVGIMNPTLYAIVPNGSPAQPLGSGLYALPLVVPTTSPAVGIQVEAGVTAANEHSVADAVRNSGRSVKPLPGAHNSVRSVSLATSPLSSTETASPSSTTSPSPTTTATATSTSSKTATSSGTATATPSRTATPSSTPSPSATPLPSVKWQPSLVNIDAIDAASVRHAHLITAREASVTSGLAATVGILGGGRLLAVPYRLPAPSVRVVKGRFMLGNKPLPYLAGINYEGPIDRPWQLWQDGKFDPTLVAEDLDAAAAAGYTVLRVFVQDPLPDQVLQGEFGHLDTLVTLARERNLRLLITFNDSRDLDLTRVAAVDRAIAGHLRGNPAIFGYDLQNEPSYQDIVAATYPSGYGIPLQSAALVDQYGQYVTLKKVQSQRKAGRYENAPYTQMTDAQVWVYLNVANIVDEFFAANPSYPATPASAHWTAVPAAINSSVATYIQVLGGAVRAADPTHMITIGYNRSFWAGLPANAALDFRSYHLYPTSQSFDSIHSSLQLFEDLRSGGSSPLVLGEYGFSTASQPSDVASVQESAMDLYLRVLGGSGDLKWMLNDDSVGANPYENNLGLFASGGTAKAAFYVDRARNAYFAAPHQPGGAEMWDASSTGIGYLYAAPDALGVSGPSYSDDRVTYQAAGGAGGAELWMDWAQPGELHVVSTTGGSLTVDLALLAGAAPGTITVSPAQIAPRYGTRLTLPLHADTAYTIQFAAGSTGLPKLSPDLPVPAQEQGWYILATGHNIVSPMLDLWLNMGSTAVAGSPIDDAQPHAGGAVQYFTGVAMQANGNSASLLPLGLEAIGGQAYPVAKELPAKTKHWYFKKTGHNLRGSFLAFWQATGGQAVWGPAETEEITKGSKIVQYFANGEFVWNGSGVSPAPLGANAWAAGSR